MFRVCLIGFALLACGKATNMVTAPNSHFEAQDTLPNYITFWYYSDFKCSVLTTVGGVQLNTCLYNTEKKFSYIYSTSRSDCRDLRFYTYKDPYCTTATLSYPVANFACGRDSQNDGSSYVSCDYQSVYSSDNTITETRYQSASKSETCNSDSPTMFTAFVQGACQTIFDGYSSIYTSDSDSVFIATYSTDDCSSNVSSSTEVSTDFCSTITNSGTTYSEKGLYMIGTGSTPLDDKQTSIMHCLLYPYIYALIAFGGIFVILMIWAVYFYLCRRRSSSQGRQEVKMVTLFTNQRTVNHYEVVPLEITIVEE